MNNLLLDLLSAQVDKAIPFNGGSEYIKSIFRAFTRPESIDRVHVLLSRSRQLDPVFEEEVRRTLPPERIHLLEEISVQPGFWQANGIGRFFIGIFQRYRDLGDFLDTIPSSVAITATIHDIVEHVTEWTPKRMLFENASRPRQFLLTWLRGRRRQERSREATRALFALLDERANTRWVADSEYTRATILHHLGGRPDRIDVHWTPASPNQIMAASRQPEPPRPNAPYLMLAANRWSKNLLCALDAGQMLVSSGYDFRLKLVGNFHGMPIRRRIENLPWIEIASYGSPDALLQLVTSSRGLLFPTWCEGFGYPPLEALLAGRPVIASSASCVPEVLGEAGFYHSPSNPLQLAHQIRCLEIGSGFRTNTKDLRGFGERCLARQATDLERLYNALFMGNASIGALIDHG